MVSPSVEMFHVFEFPSLSGANRIQRRVVAVW